MTTSKFFLVAALAVSAAQEIAAQDQIRRNVRGNSKVESPARRIQSKGGRSRGKGKGSRGKGGGKTGKYGFYDASKGYYEEPSKGYYEEPSKGYDEASKGYYEEPSKGYDEASKGYYEEPSKGYDEVSKGYGGKGGGKGGRGKGGRGKGGIAKGSDYGGDEYGCVPEKIEYNFLAIPAQNVTYVDPSNPDSKVEGTSYLFNFGLFDWALQNMTGYMVGTCTRTQKAVGELLGGGMCDFFMTDLYENSVHVTGEVFDGELTALAITGGTYEYQGASGMVEMVPYYPADATTYDVFDDVEYYNGTMHLYVSCLYDYGYEAY
jgi:hypothetical protein